MNFPWIAENIFLSLGDTLLGTNFVRELKNWRKLESYNREEIARLQNQRLKELLTHTVKNIPFYKHLETTLRNKEVRDWIQQFPIMKKADIKANLSLLTNTDLSTLVVEKSSGSSGIQGEVYMTRQEQYNSIAAQTFLWEWAGYQLGQPMLQLGMTINRSGIKGLKDKLLRTNYQQAFNINKEEVSKVLVQSKGKQIFFGGYASGLYSYAMLAEQLGISDVKFKSVISWGDKMFPHYRKKIESKFNTKVFDTYGCTEGFMIAGQCAIGNYHILTPHVYLEILDENGNEVPPGELGYVVVTRLDAYAMPLIRYYLGDLAIKEDPKKTCACGKPFPLLRQVIGRDTDIVQTRSGKSLIVHFFTGIFEHIEAIHQFRVVQDNLDSIVIEYIPNPVVFEPSILSKVEQIIQDKLEEKFPVLFHEVKDIPNTPSGKPQIIFSKIK